MLIKRLKSIGIAFRGVFDLIKQEDNAKVHLAATVFVIFAGWYFSVSTVEWVLIIFCISGVMAAEAFNTALEELTDLVSPAYHPLAGKAKDFAAAGVLLIAIGAAATGVFIFLPKILSLIL